MKTPRDDSPAQQVRRELAVAARDLRLAYERFDFACEAELVEAGVYEINALQARYAYLLRRARELEAEVRPAAAEGGEPCLS